MSLEDPSSPSGLASVDEAVTRLLLQLKERMDYAKRQREERKDYEIRGMTNLPDGRATINVPESDRDPSDDV